MSKLTEMLSPFRGALILVGIVVCLVLGPPFYRSLNPHPMVGQAAPAFALERLDGGAPEDLATLIGDKVVVLDFWATWCPPCRRALPQVASLAKDFAERDVAVFAVNLMEPSEKVRAYLEAEGVDVPVLLDRQGVAAQLYQVNTIPQTVVIDKEGLVCDVHVGVSMGYARSLAKAIEAALAASNEAKGGE